MTKEALKQAYDETWSAGSEYPIPSFDDVMSFANKLESIKEALAQPEQEPVITDWNAVHEKLELVWYRELSADEGLDEIQDLIDITPPQLQQEPAYRAVKTFHEGKPVYVAQPQQEPCGGCGGSGWVSRDPDIGTDQECFVCEGAGVIKPEQEPVACVQDLDEVKRKHLVYEKGMDWKDPLYTSPPQRQWVALTDEERDDWLDNYIIAEGRARAIEAKLKEKNT